MRNLQRTRRRQRHVIGECDGMLWHHRHGARLHRGGRARPSVGKGHGRGAGEFGTSWTSASVRGPVGALAWIAGLVATKLLTIQAAAKVTVATSRPTAATAPRAMTAWPPIARRSRRQSPKEENTRAEIRDVTNRGGRILHDQRYSNATAYNDARAERAACSASAGLRSFAKSRNLGPGIPMPPPHDMSGGGKTMQGTGLSACKRPRRRRCAATSGAFRRPQKSAKAALWNSPRCAIYPTNRFPPRSMNELSNARRIGTSQ